LRRLKLLLVVLTVLSVSLLLSGIAAASEISLAKNVDPLTPNVYRLGDTIHYVLTVGNPAHNAATNTLDTIIDILPDGSPETIATGVVQGPGDSNTYDLYYVVDEADLQWISGAWRVVNRLEVDGTDSLNDIIDATTSKSSVVIRPSIDLEKNVNAEDADDPTGPFVLVGDTVTFTFIVENTGDCTLTNISVDDDILGHIGTVASLAAGGTATLTATAPAEAGQYENVGTVTGTPPVGPDVNDTDPGHYFGADPDIDLEKLVDGEDADVPTGPIVEAGSTVTFTFIVQNIGNVPLTNVSVDDDMLGHIGDVSFLDVGETATFTATATAVEGQYENMGTATGTPPVGPDVTDEDPGHYFGEAPDIDLEKLVNGDDADDPTGPYVLVGDTVTFTFIVENTGNVPLTNVSVDDDILGHIGTISFLDVGEIQTLTATAPATAGQYENMGTATGTPPAGPPVSDNDPGHYFGADPDIDLEKYVNAEDADDPTGPYVLVGDTVTFTFIIENTGNVPLTNVSVDDDILGHIGDVAFLDVGGTETFTATAPATAGQYENLGTVTGTPPVGPDVTDEDPGHYFGADPAIDLEKLVNGDDADNPTGPVVLAGSTVTFTFIVENTGNVPLTDVSVDDDVLGHIGDVAFLDVGEIATLTTTATATAGQYENMGTVTGTPPVGPDVTDEDPGHYFGADPSIDLEKLVNGDDADDPTGPMVLVGDTVTFTFIVENTGNVPLFDVSVDDDILGHIGDVALLDIGETATLTTTALATAGQYENMGTATGTPPVGPDVTDEDPGHYFGADPSIDLEKLVNGDDADTPTGPSVSVGSTVTFTFVVTNTGNVTLTNISVDDSVLGHIGDIASLDAGESATLTATAAAIEGQYENMGTATGTPPVGPDVTDEDPGYYIGTARYEGFTPGFWKNHPRAWVGFGTSNLVGNVFDIPSELSDLADDTLMQALNYGGGRDIIGAARNLLRTAVAAILNAAHPNVTYPMSLGDIIDDVNEALASLNRTTMGRLQAILDAYNNLEGDITK